MENQAPTLEQALITAQREVDNILKNSARLRRYEFAPACYWRETERYWVFSAGSEQLMEEGYVPGALTICVDKIDGHVWSTEEQVRYAQSLSPIRPVAQPDSAAA